MLHLCEDNSTMQSRDKKWPRRLITAAKLFFKVTIFKYKNNAYGIQFHIEIKSNTVQDWGCVPEYKNALEDSLGSGALKKFEQIASENMQDMNTHATILYNNFCKIL